MMNSIRQILTFAALLLLTTSTTPSFAAAAGDADSKTAAASARIAASHVAVPDAATARKAYDSAVEASKIAQFHAEYQRREQDNLWMDPGNIHKKALAITEAGATAAAKLVAAREEELEAARAAERERRAPQEALEAARIAERDRKIAADAKAAVTDVATARKAYKDAVSTLNLEKAKLAYLHTNHQRLFWTDRNGLQQKKTAAGAAISAAAAAVAARKKELDAAKAAAPDQGCCAIC